MNFSQSFLALNGAPFYGALLLCLVFWAAACACFFYGASSAISTNARGVSSRLHGVAAIDMKVARLGWIFIAGALALHGIGALLSLQSALWARIAFGTILVLVPLLLLSGLFTLLSPLAKTGEEAPSDEEIEYSNPAAEPVAEAKTPDEKKAETPPETRRGAAWLNRMTPRQRVFGLAVFDSFILGGSIAALCWWLWNSPHAPLAVSGEVAMARARDAATVMWFSGVAWLLINWPSLQRTRLSVAFRGEDGAIPPVFKSAFGASWVSLLGATILLALCSVRADNFATAPIFARASLLSLASLINSVPPMLAAIGFATASWFFGGREQEESVSQEIAENAKVPLANADAKAANAKNATAKTTNANATKTDAKNEKTVSAKNAGAKNAGAKTLTAQSATLAEDGVPTFAAPIHAAVLPAVFLTARSFLTLLLPCAAAAAGTWYALFTKTNSANDAARGAAAGAEVWWGVLLLLCASLRHIALNLYQSLSATRRFEASRRAVEKLHEEVAWRTQQLTTLHGVSADLNNTLNHEQVLNIALQRLMEAVRADAGAVWLLANFDQIAADKTGESRSSGHWSEELRRLKNERGKNEVGAQSSTRNASNAPNRVSIVDDYEKEEKKIEIVGARKPKAQASLYSESETESNDVAGSDLRKQRLSSAVHILQSLSEESATNSATSDGAIPDNTQNGNGNAGEAHDDFTQDENATATNRVLDSDGATQNSDETEETKNAQPPAVSSRSRALPMSFAIGENAPGSMKSDVVPAEKSEQKLTTMQGLEGDGVYVSGPLGDWGTFVSSGGASPADSSTSSSPVVHLVSHTRDTYSGHGKLEKKPRSRKNDEPRESDEAQNASSSTRLENARPDNGVLDGSSFVHRTWRLVRATGYDTPAANRALEAMNRALEEGGMAKCARLSATWFGIIGDVHLAPIRWHGEVVGVMSVTSRGRSFGGADRRLLEALVSEVSGALRNSYVYQQARRWAERDSVTNLFNHRAMQEKLGQEMLRARNSATELTVVMMDLNNFKFFNDTYGHPVGDGVLVTVAQCLRECCRTTDILGRYGGDEFIVVLPDTDAVEALEICRRIEERVEAESYGEGGDEERRIPIGLSFGAAVYPHDGRTPLELLTVADAHLYDAKRGGSSLTPLNKEEETREMRKLKDIAAGGSFGVLDALVTAIDNKDRYTRRHSEDVTQWAILMGKHLEFSEETLRAVRVSGLLHDVGKIAVPDAILRKPGRLNDDEFAILQQHPVFGALIVKDVPNLPEVLGGIRHHHERFDGKGYPDRLSGEEIPMLGRLLAVPDCFSAMTTNRPYRKALSWAEALNEIEIGSGTQFDPQMAEAFLEVIARIISEQEMQPQNGKKSRKSSLYQTDDFPSAYA